MLAGLNRISLSTKFEVSMFTHYEDGKGNQSVEMGMVLGSFSLE